MPRLGTIEQFLTDAGLPAGGGKLYFYEPGTTTPKNTYSDSALTTANTNPVILAADGRMPDVFFSGSIKAVLTDSDDVTLDTVDPISGEEMTGAEIKAAYEGEADTNAFTNAEQTKLSGIETAADVTDEANVTDALDGATLSAVTPASDDKVLMQDTSNSDVLVTGTVSQIASTQDWGDFTSLANGEYIGVATTFVAGATIAAGQAVRASTTSAGRVILTAPVTTSEENEGTIGVAVEAATAGQDVIVVQHGFYCNTSWAWTTGDGVYVNTASSGGLVAPAPGSGAMILVGIAVDTDTLYIKPAVFR